MNKEEQCSTQRRTYEQDFGNDDSPQTLAGFGLLCGLLIGIAGFNTKTEGTTHNIGSTATVSISQPVVD